MRRGRRDDELTAAVAARAGAARPDGAKPATPAQRVDGHRQPDGRDRIDGTEQPAGSQRVENGGRPGRTAVGLATRSDGAVEAAEVDGHGPGDAGGVPVAAAALPERRVLRDEVWLVLLLTFLASALWALLDVASRPSLAGSSSVLLDTGEGTTADLAARLLRNGLAFVPILLVVHLLHRGGETARHIGLSLRPAAVLRRDVRHGAALFALVGSVGLALYLAAVAAGVNRDVLVVDGAGAWWAAPMWLISSLRFAVTEEVIVVGYLLRRLGQLGWAPNRALFGSALLRGTYHLDQGLGGFAGNLAMGLLFGRIYQRTGRVVPLVVAHFLIDAVAGIGFLALRNRVGWLPS